MEDKLLPSLHGLISKSIAPISSPVEAGCQPWGDKLEVQLPQDVSVVTTPQKKAIWRCPGGFWLEVKALFWGAQTLKNNYIIVEVIWVLGNIQQ